MFRFICAELDFGAVSEISGGPFGEGGDAVKEGMGSVIVKSAAS